MNREWVGVLISYSTGGSSPPREERRETRTITRNDTSERLRRLLRDGGADWIEPLTS